MAKTCMFDSLPSLYKQLVISMIYKQIVFDELVKKDFEEKNICNTDRIIIDEGSVE